MWSSTYIRRQLTDWHDDNNKWIGTKIRMSRWFIRREGITREVTCWSEDMISQLWGTGRWDIPHPSSTWWGRSSLFLSSSQRRPFLYQGCTVEFTQQHIPASKNLLPPTFLGFSRYSNNVSSLQVIPLLMLAAVYVKLSSWPVLRPKILQNGNVSGCVPDIRRIKTHTRGG